MLVGVIVIWSIGPIVWNAVVSVTPEIDLLQKATQYQLAQHELGELSGVTQ